jgi:excisionase family DNA binding protein
LTRRRIEIIAFEHEHFFQTSAHLTCSICGRQSELLTTKQAAALMQVKSQSILRWFEQGKIHGTRTPGGQHRICRSSLFSFDTKTFLNDGGTKQ